MNLLFVCSRNQWRSPTAEAIFKNHDYYRAKSAGVSASARIKLSEQLINWADMIFVMENEHKRRIKKSFAGSLAEKEIIVLDIEDEYQFMDPELIKIIRQSVQPYLERF